MTPLQLKQKISRETTRFGIGGILLLISIGALFFHIVE